MRQRSQGSGRKGDTGFLLRLGGAASLVLLLSILVFGFLGRSNLGGCAARGFQQIAPGEAQPSD